MMVYIVALVVIFVPFWISLAFKYSGWLTGIMTFLWCCACAALIFIMYLVILYQQLEGLSTELSIFVMCSWYVVSQYMGMKCVLLDRPGTKT